MRVFSAVSELHIGGRDVGATILQWGAGAIFFLFTGAASAHGGGLNAESCHTNRKTGEYHCHRGSGHTGVRAVPAPGARTHPSANAFMARQGSSTGPTCYRGPRGGTYTITASGRKNYGGC